MAAFLLAAVLGGMQEVILPTPGGAVALSTRGASAFRVRFLPSSDAPGPAVDTPMVAPEDADAHFVQVRDGISAAFGSLSLTAAGELQLFDATGKLLTVSEPLGEKNDTCAAQPGTDCASGCARISDRPARNVSDEAACCDACKSAAECASWIFGHPGDAEGNCWLLKSVGGAARSADRTLGGAGGGQGVSLSTSSATRLYGRGGGKADATTLHPTGAVTASVDNTVTYAPYYYSTDGYACLAVTDVLSGNGKTNVLPVTYATDGSHIRWSRPAGAAFELYLMPAPSLDSGTAAYFSLVGRPAVPPRWAFGFIASRWGWENRTYIEQTLRTFRSGRYPIDAFIGDFGWFTNVSDYSFPPSGEPSYQDFGYNEATFPSPKEQLALYASELHFHMGGIRKPRLGSSALLLEARAKGLLLPGGERRRLALGLAAAGKQAEGAQAEGADGLSYADQRNLDFAKPQTRQWYEAKQAHYLRDGVSFFWNDEGETSYYTFHHWNEAQAQTLASFNASRRFYSINRAWTPGMARLGATVWTGDINPSWDDLRNTAGLVVNWGLGGAPYVACDTGGFTGQSNAPLLTRWFQLATFMPTMRVHSTKSATPHFPWLWGEPYASTMRDALELRYRLLPYHYSLAHGMHATGRLWMRPLAAEFPADERAARVASQWLDGPSAPVPAIPAQRSARNRRAAF